MMHHIILGEVLLLDQNQSYHQQTPKHVKPADTMKQTRSQSSTLSVQSDNDFFCDDTTT